jgi:hypothetical protein
VLRLRKRRAVQVQLWQRAEGRMRHDAPAAAHTRQLQAAHPHARERRVPQAPKHVRLRARSRLSALGAAASERVVSRAPQALPRPLLAHREGLQPLSRSCCVTRPRREPPVWCRFGIW